jgi:hypothetical protein
MSWRLPVSSPAENTLRNRARHRAVATLVSRHRNEYDDLYDAALQEVRDEAERDLARVIREHPDARPPVKPAGVSGPKFRTMQPVPPRLQPGPLKSGTAERPLRDDVARCPYCQRFHDRGHECSSCRHRPPGAPARPVTYVRDA